MRIQTISNRNHAKSDHQRSEIGDMRSRGFDPSTIQEARTAYERGLMADQLIVRIEAAFHDVVLGDGIGLSEGQGMDDYADAAARATLREDDEKEDWKHAA
ncbi:MAG: hypothetical protein JWM59_4205 [Verrucomicrobiales bacterium]|nr:hypothetical protein [Verrucomicrobiales bacterium]